MADSKNQFSTFLIVFILLTMALVAYGMYLIRKPTPTPKEISQPQAPKKFELLSEEEKVDILQKLAPPPGAKKEIPKEEKKQLLEELAPPKTESKGEGSGLTEEQKKSILDSLKPK